MASEPAMKCAVDNRDVCTNMAYALDAKVGAGLEDLKDNVRPRKFAEWMFPLARYVFTMTGYPASLLVGHAGFISSWGRSEAFQDHHNIYDLNCSTVGAKVSGQLVIDKDTWSFHAECKGPKKKGRGNFWHFAKWEDSVSFFLSMVLQSKMPIYERVQEELAKSWKTFPARPPSVRTVTPMLTFMTSTTNFMDAVFNGINDLNLIQYDDFECWNCMRKKREKK